MKRTRSQRDKLDKLARRLHARSQTMLREGRIDEFAGLIHPLELARFKAFFLALSDAAAIDLIAQDLLTKFDAHLLRKELVEFDGRDIAAAYLRIVLDSSNELGQQDEGTPDWLSRCDLVETTSYFGVVPEGDQTLHVLYTAYTWPTLATYQRHDGEWKLRFRSNLAKFTTWLQRRTLQGKDGATVRDVLEDAADMKVNRLEMIGYLTSDSWAYIVYRLETVMGDFESIVEAVYPMNQEHPAWSQLDNPTKIEATLLDELMQHFHNSITPLLKTGVEFIDQVDKTDFG